MNVTFLYFYCGIFIHNKQLFLFVLVPLFYCFQFLIASLCDVICILIFCCCLFLQVCFKDLWFLETGEMKVFFNVLNIYGTPLNFYALKGNSCLRIYFSDVVLGPTQNIYWQRHNNDSVQIIFHGCQAVRNVCLLLHALVNKFLKAAFFFGKKK